MSIYGHDLCKPSLIRNSFLAEANDLSGMENAREVTVDDSIVSESAEVIEESVEDCEVDFNLLMELSEMNVSLLDDIDSLEETVVDNIKKHFTDIADLKKQWKKFADTMVQHEWIFRYLDDKRMETCKKYYEMLVDDNVSYGNYKKAFKFFCSFMGLPYNKTILENIVFTENKKDPDRCKVSVKYSKGLVKVNIPDDIELVHVSPVQGIKELIPTFRSKVKGKYMYPSKRCFFTVKGTIRKNQAGLEKQKITSYKTKNHYNTAYIDPTYSKFKDGCVYIETESPIPVVPFISSVVKKLLK